MLNDGFDAASLVDVRAAELGLALLDLLLDFADEGASWDVALLKLSFADEGATWDVALLKLSSPLSAKTENRLLDLSCDVAPLDLPMTVAKERRKNAFPGANKRAPLTTPP